MARRWKCCTAFPRPDAAGYHEQRSCDGYRGQDGKRSEPHEHEGHRDWWKGDCRHECCLGGCDVWVYVLAVKNSLLLALGGLLLPHYWKGERGGCIYIPGGWKVLRGLLGVGGNCTCRCTFYSA